MRARVIGSDSKRGDDPSLDRIIFVPGVFAIPDIDHRLVLEMQKLGGCDLVIIDTSAAYFLSDDENSNPQMGAHARMLRGLSKLPGTPTVLALCHPAKYVTDPSQLLPRGGGAFLAEMDGNLTAWRHDDDLVDLHHGDKFRGPGFEPITLRIEKITTTKLVDKKGRLVPTVRTVALSETEEAEVAQSSRRDEDHLMTVLLFRSDCSIADLARACGWLLADGEPAKSKTYRTAERLHADRLAKRSRGRWTLTEDGRKAAEKLQQAKIDEIAEARGGKTSCKQGFFAVLGKKLARTVPCIHCHVADGNVFKIKDGRVLKGRGEALHEGCAKDWFEGKPSPESV